MTIVQPTTRPLYHAAYTGTAILETGITNVGEITLSGMTLLSGDSEAAFLNAVNGKAGAYKPLPATGWLESGAIYGYSGGLVIVRQSHNRTEHAPETVPNLFSVYRADATGELAWITNEKVAIGTRRTYGGKTWEALQAHTTQTDWMPPNVPALWREVVVVPPTGEWKAGVAYRVGDEVTYKSKLYRCRQAHTSIVTWEPDKVLSLWLPL